MTPARRRAHEDSTSYGIRMAIYALCIVLPFVALLVGKFTGEQTVAAVLTLTAALGPALALVNARKDEDVKQDAFETGYTLAVEDVKALDAPDYQGRHRAPGEGQR